MNQSAISNNLNINSTPFNLSLSLNEGGLNPQSSLFFHDPFNFRPFFFSASTSTFFEKTHLIHALVESCFSFFNKDFFKDLDFFSLVYEPHQESIHEHRTWKVYYFERQDCTQLPALAIPWQQVEAQRLAASGEINQIGDYDQKTPLMRACDEFEVDLLFVEHLLKNGANTNVSGYLGETPLIRAIARQNYSLVKLLLDYHADPSKSDTSGYTPVYYSIVKKNIRVLELLLQLSASLESQGSEKNPLFCAVRLSWNQGVQALLEYGASCSCLSQQGQGVLHLLKNSDVALLKLILSFSPVESFLLQDEEGRTPLAYWINQKKFSLVRWVLSEISKEGNLFTLLQSRRFQGINSSKIKLKQQIEKVRLIRAIKKSLSIKNSYHQTPLKEAQALDEVPADVIELLTQNKV